MFSSCTPQLSSKLSLYEISPEQTEEQIVNFKSQSHPRVRVSLVNDLRTQRVVAEMDSENYGESGDATKVIQHGVEKCFANNGYEVILYNAPTILVELSGWYTKITPQTFTTLVDSNAEIIVSLLNRQGKVIYRSIYDGSYTKSTMFVNQEDIEKMHMKAMEFAIQEASADDKLRGAAQENQF